MPCYTLQTIAVEFTTKHRDRLIDAAKALGLEVTDFGKRVRIDNLITIDLGRSRARYDADDEDAVETLNLLKKQYAISAISTAATKAGWSKTDIARLSARRKINKVTITRR